MRLKRIDETIGFIFSYFFKLYLKKKELKTCHLSERKQTELQAKFISLQIKRPIFQHFQDYKPPQIPH